MTSNVLSGRTAAGAILPILVDVDGAQLMRVAANPVPVVQTFPSISGPNLVVGSTLTCSTGTWSPAPTDYTYQWTRNGANIGGATAATHVLVAGDVGTRISCTVTAINADGSTAVSATATAPITAT